MDATKFRVNAQTTAGAHIVALSGELDLSTADMLRRQTEALAADAARKLVLDMRELAYIDSTGIGVIVSLLKVRQAAGQGIHVQHVPAKVRRLFDMTGLTRFLTFIEGPEGTDGSMGQDTASGDVPSGKLKGEGQ
ncbi:STAS domain-containing protein [Paenibacillus puerhi]|uniref:STAS domain-containing protein n=1 Tax=Paenibacillus puerhi TaxID=2692622 RepID=UPI00135969F6|nr:STAS domain-containing protein [Paenibacillus puerhi]